jgi:hypothetical protein
MEEVQLKFAKLAIEASPYDGRDYSIELTLAVSVFKMV